MTQNIKKKQTLSAWGVIKFTWTSPLRQCCKLQQRLFGQLGKNHVYSSKNKIVFRKYIGTNVLKINFIFKICLTKINFPIWMIY
jgi:hypothetical protein